MNTNNAVYWIALGVLALGLNSEYQHGKFAALHRVAERADSVLCQITTHAEQTLAVATGLTSRGDRAVDDLLASTAGAEMARDQAELVREQARDQAELLVRNMVRDRVREQVRDKISAQAEIIRAQAEMRRAEIEQIRFRTSSQFRLAGTANRRITVVCPKTGARIVVNAGADLADVSPDVERTF
jgi:hypothetical protein